eukprot:6202130-Pleurochrysis_carterae.AAC.6
MNFTMFSRIFSPVGRALQFDVARPRRALASEKSKGSGAQLLLDEGLRVPRELRRAHVERLGHCLGRRKALRAGDPPQQRLQLARPARVLRGCDGGDVDGSDAQLLLGAQDLHGHLLRLYRPLGARTRAEHRRRAARATDVGRLATQVNSEKAFLQSNEA